MQEGHLPSCCMMLTASYMFSLISCYGVNMKQVAFCNTLAPGPLHMNEHQLQILT